LASAERALHLEMRSGLGVARIVAMRKVWIASVLNRQPVSEKLQREQQREGAQRLLLSLDLNSDIDRHGQHRTEPGIESKAFCADFSQRFGHLFRTCASRPPRRSRSSPAYLDQLSLSARAEIPLSACPRRKRSLSP